MADVDAARRMVWAVFVTIPLVDLHMHGSMENILVLVCIMCWQQRYGT